jgi:hypothetical protein
MYRHQDFTDNPGKYRLFKTAAVAQNIFTHNGEHDLSAGAYVGVEFFAVQRNQLRRREEPVYSIKTQDGQFWGHLYASALADFCL